ncbi:hypothetical protein DMENIID0001_032460 [Sergentomyia squamirostris]
MLVIPSWMDTDFFQNVLVKILKRDRNYEVKEVIVSVPTGGSSSEGVYRSRIVYEDERKKDKSITVIVKRLSPEKVESSCTSLSMRHSKSMSVEVDMHLNILPTMLRLLEVAGINAKLGPQHFANINVPCEVLILEDIAQSGYEIISRRFDLKSVEIILQKLAQFHATSYFMAVEDKKDFSKFRNGVFNFGTQGTKFFLEGLQYFTREALKWPELKHHHVKIRGLEERFMDARNYLYRSESEYNVLNHGDFHMRNIMFKVSNSFIEDVVMHDFQTNVWCSPALDLIYTFYLVADSETLQNSRHAMVSFYHSIFTATLKSMGFMGRTPTLLDLNIELIQNGFIEIFVAITFLPYQYLSFASQRLQERITQETDQSNARSLLYTIPEYQRTMKRLFNFYLLKGFMDY